MRKRGSAAASAISLFQRGIGTAIIHADDLPSGVGNGLQTGKDGVVKGENGLPLVIKGDDQGQTLGS